MKLAYDLFRPGTSVGKKLSTLGKAAAFYVVWYPGTILKTLGAWLIPSGLPSPIARHERFVRRSTPALARSVFHSMLRFGPGLEKRQRTLGRLVDIGTDLFAMGAVLARADSLVKATPADRTPLAVADVFCEEARRRVCRNVRSLWMNDDKDEYKLAQDVLAGKLAWLEKGVIGNV
jgi:hypothetical protein